MASIAVIVFMTIIAITCNGVASKPTEKYLTRLLDVLNPPETIFPEFNKGTTLSSSGKKVNHVDYERKRRQALPDVIGGDGGFGSVMFLQSSQSNLNEKNDSTNSSTTTRERRHALPDVIGGDGGFGSVMFLQSSQSNLNEKNDSTNSSTTTRERRHALPDVIGGDGGFGSVMFLQSLQSNLNEDNDGTNTATTTDDKNMLLRLSHNFCCYCLCCQCKFRR
ncbi:uncharacterized protein LOC126551798 isoform X3 [Aphis gossypii]|uniref:uncharacterized protein LOC126551798 isoform X2 n=1 Tax=Aphis gossypii TaxID=80765 RepID=UPI002159496E|nr:uncharacterized protein LOC126551798 isoform X2 [Aphis gossypii]XP_050061968.1 uncharacterized protein LOC126551798 isoform X3 [Aphis gossypii]